MSSSDISAFPVALHLRGRSVLVIGGSEEAEQKIPKLLQAGARVTLVAPQAVPSLATLARTRAITWFARTVLPTDLAGAHVVLLTEPDPELAARLRLLQSSNRFWLCAIDQPEFSDFFLVSTVTRGPVQIAISTGGRAPLLARRLRTALEHGLDETFGEFARRFAHLRAQLRSLPKKQRKEALEQALNGFAMEVRVSYPANEGDGASPPRDGPPDI